MNELESLIHAARDLWRGLGLGHFERNLAIALAVGALFYVLVYAAERVSGTRTDNYCSRSFFHDAVYWFYYRSGLNYILFIAILYPPFDQPLAFLDFKLIASLPIAAQALIFFVFADFYSYWSHRAAHYFKPLWAFHTTHHAPERITFASSARFHPVEVTLQYSGIYVLSRILCGNDPLAWLPMMIFMEVMLEAQHTQIPWKLGWLGRVFVTPTFHWYHHSADPAHYDKNFGAVLSVWDYLFGTAVKDGEPLPARLGLQDVKQPSLWSSLAMPFQILYRSLASRGLAKAAQSTAIDRP